jgi:hypothetical protein
VKGENPCRLFRLGKRKLSYAQMSYEWFVSRCGSQKKKRGPNGCGPQRQSGSTQIARNQSIVGSRAGKKKTTMSKVDGETEMFKAVASFAKKDIKKANVQAHRNSNPLMRRRG